MYVGGEEIGVGGGKRERERESLPSKPRGMNDERIITIDETGPGTGLAAGSIDMQTRGHFVRCMAMDGPLVYDPVASARMRAGFLHLFGRGHRCE
jgi:hypothetical protein